MEKLTIEQLKELLEFYYEYDELVMIKNHIEYVINNINDKIMTLFQMKKYTNKRWIVWNSVVVTVFLLRMSINVMIARRNYEKHGWIYI